MWFYPPENNKHGWIKFGWGSGFPQGGMNDQGLFWDASAGAYLAMPLSEANKEKYPGPLMQKVIEECANVEEALETFAEYYCKDQYWLQHTRRGDIQLSIQIFMILRIATYIYSTDPEFTEINSKCLTYIYYDLTGHSCFIYFLPGLFLIIPWIKRKRIIYSSIIIMFVALLSYQCKKEETTTPEVQVEEMSETISNLQPNTTYYWKIRAHPKNQDDFRSETLTRCFNT